MDAAEPKAYRSTRYSPELLALTREVWEPRYGRNLGDGEVEEIIRNVIQFIQSLEMTTVESQGDSLDGDVVLRG